MHIIMSTHATSGGFIFTLYQLSTFIEIHWSCRMNLPINAQNYCKYLKSQNTVDTYDDMEIFVP